jgi:hypothetical protein
MKLAYFSNIFPLNYNQILCVAFIHITFKVHFYYINVQLYFYYIKATFIDLLHILQFVYYPILINVIQTEVKNINNNNKQKKIPNIYISFVIIIRESTKIEKKNIN